MFWEKIIYSHFECYSYTQLRISLQNNFDFEHGQILHPKID